MTGDLTPDISTSSWFTKSKSMKTWTWFLILFSTHNMKGGFFTEYLCGRLGLSSWVWLLTYFLSLLVFPLLKSILYLLPNHELKKPVRTNIYQNLDFFTPSIKEIIIGAIKTCQINDPLPVLDGTVRFIHVKCFMIYTQGFNNWISNSLLFCV